MTATREQQRPIEHVRELYKAKGLDAVWKWCMAPDGAHRKAKRFAVAERWAEINRDRAEGKEREEWAERRRAYASARDTYERRYEANHELKLPDRIKFYELLYHDPPHLHVACAYDTLLVICKVAREKLGIAVREFPPFDTVDNVHVNPGSYHTRDKDSPGTPRYYADFVREKLSGLAADLNDIDGGNDQEYALYIELKRRMV